MNDLKKARVKLNLLIFFRFLPLIIGILIAVFTDLSLLAFLLFLSFFAIYALTINLFDEFKADVVYYYEKSKKDSLLDEVRPFALILRGFRKNELNSLPVKTYQIENDEYNIPQPSLTYFIGQAINKNARPVALESPAAFSLDFETNEFPEFRDKFVNTPITYLNASRDGWMDIVSFLARNSYFIVVIPNNSQGLLEEVEFIVKNKLQYKVIVVMPPESIQNDVHLVAEWEKNRELFKQKLQLNLPEHFPSGLLYIPNTDFGEIEEEIQFSKDAHYKSVPAKLSGISLNKSLEYSFKHLMHSIPAAPNSTREVFKQLSDKGIPL